MFFHTTIPSLVGNMFFRKSSRKYVFPYHHTKSSRKYVSQLMQGGSGDEAIIAGSGIINRHISYG